jgi:hypothetical protein
MTTWKHSLVPHSVIELANGLGGERAANKRHEVRLHILRVLEVGMKTWAEEVTDHLETHVKSDDIRVRDKINLRELKRGAFLAGLRRTSTPDVP